MDVMGKPLAQRVRVASHQPERRREWPVCGDQRMLQQGAHGPLAFLADGFVESLVQEDRCRDRFRQNVSAHGPPIGAGRSILSPNALVMVT